LRSELIAGFEVSDQEVADVVAFLNTLTDTQFVTNPAHSNPWKRSGKQ
jgi:cytochrome c peroxidase